MQQIVPGIFHWSAYHDPIGADVSSYLVVDAAAVIDPKVPDEGLDALPVRPKVVLLSSGHHLRDARVFAEHFDIPIRASEQAVKHLGSDGEGIEAWDAGDPQPAPEITALEIGVLCADEGALHIAVGDGALVIADAVHHEDEGLGFFPDSLLGDDPEAIKQGLKAQLDGLCESLQFDALLPAHGEPIASGARKLRQVFADR